LSFSKTILTIIVKIFTIKLLSIILLVFINAFSLKFVISNQQNDLKSKKYTLNNFNKNEQHAGSSLLKIEVKIISMPIFKSAVLNFDY